MPESLQPEESPGLLLWRTSLRWQRQITAALKPLGLTHVQFVLLTSAWWLDRQAGLAPNQRDLADHAAIDAMMTSQVLRSLAAKDLIRRDRDTADSRALRITVTDEGAGLAVRAVQIVEAADIDFFTKAPDRPALLTALRALGASQAPRDHSAWPGGAHRRGDDLGVRSGKHIGSRPDSPSPTTQHPARRPAL